MNALPFSFIDQLGEKQHKIKNVIINVMFKLR